MQGELVGDFRETDIDIVFGQCFVNISRSLNSFSLSRIFRRPLNYKESDGASLMSLASVQLEFCIRVGPNMSIIDS